MNKKAFLNSVSLLIANWLRAQGFCLFQILILCLADWALVHFANKALFLEFLISVKVLWVLCKLLLSFLNDLFILSKNQKLLAQFSLKIKTNLELLFFDKIVKPSQNRRAETFSSCAKNDVFPYSWQLKKRYHFWCSYTQYGPIKNSRIKNQPSDFGKK